jgi:hypothetical protein
MGVQRRKRGKEEEKKDKNDSIRIGKVSTYIK